MSSDNPQQGHTLFKAIHETLRPLVRLAINHGLSVQDFITSLKVLYVEEAEKNKIEGRKQNTSRIAVITGLSRKEVTKLRKLGQETSALHEQYNQNSNRAIRAVNGWKTRPEYQEKGEPKVLPIRGEEESFENLAKLYCGDVTATSILLELKQSGIVETDNQGNVKLVKTSYVPEDMSEIFSIMGQANSDFLNTVTHNVQSPSNDSRLQLSVNYNNVNAEVANRFKVLIKRDSREFLEKLNLWLKEEIHSYDGEETDQLERIGLGLYYFEKKKESPNGDKE